MTADNSSTKVAATSVLYRTAHDSHYEAKDLFGALGLYRAIVSEFPGAPEAGFARAQIQNIVNSVVPKQELFEVQMDLALSHIAAKNKA